MKDDTILELEDIDNDELLKEVGLRPSLGSRRVFNLDEGYEDNE